MGMLEENPKAKSDACLACTACITTCPITAATQEFRGPKLIGPAQGRLHFAEDDVEPSIDYCSNCKNCDISCPSGISVSTLNMLQRGAYYKKHRHPLRDNMLAHSERMMKLARKMPLGVFFANLGMEIGSKSGMLKAIGIAGKRSMPKFASQSFLQRFRKLKQTAYPDKVVFFPGCYINDNAPQVGMAFVEVMQQNHYEVIVDEKFVCCGSPLVVTGYLDEAKENARKNTERLRFWREQKYPVITCCTSCSLMLKQEYEELFGQEEMHKNGENIFDSFEFLWNLKEKGQLDTKLKPLAKSYIYHAPCHLRVQGIGLPALGLLSLIPGLSVENADAGCCGISGNYGLKEDKYEISMKVGQELFKRIEDSSSEAVLSDCGTCRMQIEHGTTKKAFHPMELLAAAYR